MSDFGRLQELARAAGVAVNPPMNTAIPAVTPDTVAVGGALSCTMGEWTGTPDSYAYAWFIDGADSGQTGASYTTVAGNEGHAVTCVVTATNDAGSASAPPSNAAMVTATAVRAAPEHEESGARDAHADARRENTDSRRR